MASPLSRRRFLRSSAFGTAALATAPSAYAQAARPDATPSAIRPRRLRPGDTVALVAPAGMVRSEADLDDARQAMRDLGLRTVDGAHVLDRHGYLAGQDADRAADLMAAFRDPAITGMVAVRGGWGSARLLPYLDWPTIRQNPKVVLGYSDLTSLLLAMLARTGVVGFHGPVATSSFSAFTLGSLRSVVFGDAEDPFPRDVLGDGTQTIRPGIARGRLVGGNLTVLAAMVGTPYVPSFDGHILFLEDIGESVYRVDRMLTQLGQAGLLGGLAGFVLGSCRGCTPEPDALGTFTLGEVVRQHIEPLGIPAYLGAPFGHVRDKWTLPLGALAEIDGGARTLRLVEPAVV